MSRSDHDEVHARATRPAAFALALPLVLAAAAGIAMSVGRHGPGPGPAGDAAPASGQAGPSATPEAGGPGASPVPGDDGTAPEAAGDEAATAGPDGTASPEATVDPDNPFDLVSPGTPIDAAAAAPFALLLPDSEFVYGPTLYGFDTVDYVAEQAGFLSRHLEVVDGQTLIGGQIVERVARDYSIGPRMLLAIVEMRSGWVSQAQPPRTTDPLATGVGGTPSALYNGLADAAEALQALYYAHRLEGVRAFPLGGGRSASVSARNPGTWALTAWLSRGVAPEAWPGLEAQSRFWTAWVSLFGEDPYAFQTTETLPPGPLRSPLRLPFADGATWYFVEGPASPRGAGAARASVGFAPPPAQAGGCLPSVEPVLAVADGRIVRSGDGGVALDLDTDDFEGSGWVLVYRHLIPEGRVAAGTRVSAGDRLGFPGCVDGESDLNQIRIARKHNGEWVPADRADSPWVLGGWIVTPGAQEGQGAMTLPGLGQRSSNPTKSDPVNGIAALPGR